MLAGTNGKELGFWAGLASKSMSHLSTPISGIEQAMGSDSGMDKKPKAGVPGPVAFPLSLPGLPRNQRPVFFGPTKTLGQSGPTGTRELVVNKGSPCLESISAADHFIKLATRL